MFIGGQWIAAQDRQTLPVFSPVDGEQFDSISRGRAHEVDLAVKAANHALEGAWGRLNATERGQIMIRINEKVLENVDELSRLEVKDTGKPISIARNDHLSALLRILRGAIATARVAGLNCLLEGC
jgi:aldehyde dehydrogenase (NAD+)